MEKFKLNCFEYLEGSKYSEGHWNDLVMELIETGIEYYKTLTPSIADEFNLLEKKLNEIKIALGEDPKDYGSDFKYYYNEHFTI